MFSLIITIVSIALVVALVAATMYHGGDTLTQGRTTADAAAYVAGAQQVGGAAVMFLSLEGTAPLTISGGAAATDLVAKDYLASAPSVKADDLTLDSANRLVTGANVPNAICQAINKSAGVAATAGEYTADAAAIANLAYGCIVADATAAGTFQFKY